VLQAQTIPDSTQQPVPIPDSTQSAQTVPDSTKPIPAEPDPIKSAEAIQARIQRARALIAAHQLETAASELESVRAATQDFAARNITSVMLMSVYLEEGNYGRAEALLEENFRSRSLQNGDSLRTYFALAGQAVNGARTHLARYRSFGINTTDSSLPAEAVSDLDRLRSFLERMIAQAKEISNGRKVYDSLSLLEDVLGIRLSLARDNEDQSKWEAEYAGARELLASSETQIASLSGMSGLPNKGPLSKVSAPSPYSTRRTSETAEPTSSESNASPNEPKPAGETAPSSQSTAVDKNVDASAATTSEPKLSDFGLLNAKASKRVLPRYPIMARQAGTTGLVRVWVVVDENGKVVEVSRSEGPLLLRQVAEDAARQWFFEGIAGPGKAERFTGYIDFNFTL
jgi:TonB family protein